MTPTRTRTATPSEEDILPRSPLLPHPSSSVCNECKIKHPAPPCASGERERERASDRAVLGLEEDGDDVVSGRRVLAQPQDVLQGRDVHGRDDVWPMATAKSAWRTSRLSVDDGGGGPGGGGGGVGGTDPAAEEGAVPVDPEAAGRVKDGARFRTSFEVDEDSFELRWVVSGRVFARRRSSFALRCLYCIHIARP